MTPLLVFLGAGAGGLARYGISRWMMTAVGTAFPWGTLTVNVVGSFVITFGIGWMQSRGMGLPRQDFLAAGFCGGFTTFSAFSVETLRMLEGGQGPRAALYVAASVLLAVGAALAGLRLAPGHA
jgi:fluoride exporter